MTDTIDTYQVEPVVTVEVDALAEFREQAKEATKGPKMSDRAATLLRAIGEHDRANKAADAILVKCSTIRRRQSSL